MSLQVLVSIPCNDNNAKVWRHTVEIDNIQERWASCDNHREELHKAGIKIISESKSPKFAEGFEENQL